MLLNVHVRNTEDKPKASHRIKAHVQPLANPEEKEIEDAEIGTGGTGENREMEQSILSFTGWRDFTFQFLPTTFVTYR